MPGTLSHKAMIAAMTINGPETVRVSANELRSVIVSPIATAGNTRPGRRNTHAVYLKVATMKVKTMVGEADLFKKPAFNPPPTRPKMNNAAVSAVSITASCSPSGAVTNAILRHEFEDVLGAGGELFCRFYGDRVFMRGRARLVSEVELTVEAGPVTSAVA
jgi:hypothetical protein